MPVLDLETVLKKFTFLVKKSEKNSVDKLKEIFDKSAKSFYVRN
jgi:hypothetical protein